MFRGFHTTASSNPCPL